MMRVEAGAISRWLAGFFCFLLRIGSLSDIRFLCDIIFLCRSHNCFVDSLPVVEVLSLAPEFLEERLTLAYGCRGIEIPGIGVPESVSGTIPESVS